MIPCDFWLMAEGYNEGHTATGPGANAPSMDEARELVEKYG